jgi:hypothetical protein
MATDDTCCIASIVVLKRGELGVFVLLVCDAMSQENGTLNYTAAGDKIIL